MQRSARRGRHDGVLDRADDGAGVLLGTGYVERGTFAGSGTVLALAAFVLVVLGALLWGKRSRRQATWIGAAAFGFGLIVVLRTLDS